MSSRREWFDIYKDTPPSPIRTADGGTIIATGVGTIDLNLKTGQRISEAYLDEVLYIPDLHGNLFSLNKMVKLGNKATFDLKDCTITSKSGKTITIATRV